MLPVFKVCEKICALQYCVIQALTGRNLAQLIGSRS